jgi:hypothetical protein
LIRGLADGTWRVVVRGECPGESEYSGESVGVAGGEADVDLRPAAR